MSKILMTVWPIETHLSPFMAVAQCLTARGHEVAFYTSGQLRNQLEREGFRCFPFERVTSHHAECNPGAVITSKMGVRARRQMWHDFLLGSVPGQLQDLERIWTAWQPDVVVCDITMWGPILVVHETKQVPLAVLAHTAYCLLEGREHPAPGISLPRPRTPAARLVARLLTAGINTATASIPREASRIRRAHGLPSLDSTVMEFTGRLPLHLVPSAPEFDYERRDLPSSVRYVGPCMWEGDPQPAPEWVTSMRGRRRIVVLEEQHYPEDGFLLKIAARAFAGQSAGVILMAGQGRDLSAFDLGASAANIRLEPWAPLSHAISSADLVIAHGCSETVLATLGRGIPMVVVPRMLEQPQIAWRLAATGTGIRLPMRGCTPERLRHTAERVLSDSSSERNAGRIRAAFTRMGGPSRAAESIEGLDRNYKIPVERGREQVHAGSRF